MSLRKLYQRSLLQYVSQRREGEKAGAQSLLQCEGKSYFKWTLIIPVSKEGCTGASRFERHTQRIMKNLRPFSRRKGVNFYYGDTVAAFWAFGG